MKIKHIFDAGPLHLDRYTVVLDSPLSFSGMFEAYTMSDNPTHPTGFGQHIDVANGWVKETTDKRISFNDLPTDCQDCLTNLEYLP